MTDRVWHNDVSAYCFDKWGIVDAWPRLRSKVYDEAVRLFKARTGEVTMPEIELTIMHPAFVRVMEHEWWFENYKLVS